VIFAWINFYNVSFIVHFPTIVISFFGFLSLNSVRWNKWWQTHNVQNTTPMIATLYYTTYFGNNVDFSLPEVCPCSKLATPTSLINCFKFINIVLLRVSAIYIFSQVLLEKLKLSIFWSTSVGYIPIV